MFQFSATKRPAAQGSPFRPSQAPDHGLHQRPNSDLLLSSKPRADLSMPFSVSVVSIAYRSHCLSSSTHRVLAANRSQPQSYSLRGAAIPIPQPFHRGVFGRRARLLPDPAFRSLPTKCIPRRQESTQAKAFVGESPSRAAPSRPCEACRQTRPAVRSLPLRARLSRHRRSHAQTLRLGGHRRSQAERSMHEGPHPSACRPIRC